MASTGEVWKLGHRPALDGVRGIAVLLVVAYHAMPAHLVSAGVVGVTVFFTLSGFLITSLLVDELERDGSVRLGRFYLRRFARLAPALASLLVFAAVAAALGSALFDWSAITAAGLYVSNWVAASGHMLGGLQHTWSLAVEEQFYLLWPLVVIGVGRRPRALVVVCVAGIIGSVTARFMFYDGTAAGVYRTYFGLDTRADALLVGCLLALVMRRMRPGHARPALATVVVAGLLVAALDPSYLHRNVAWPTLVPFLAAGLIYFLTRGDYTGWMTSGPLALVGRRSYGLYLWHLPVFLLLDNPLLGLSVAWSLTVLSWRFVEVPAGRALRSLVAQVEHGRASPAARVVSA